MNFAPAWFSRQSIYLAVSFGIVQQASYEQQK
jgi:hypothetical protein